MLFLHFFVFCHVNICFLISDMYVENMEEDLKIAKMKEEVISIKEEILQSFTVENTPVVYAQKQDVQQENVLKENVQQENVQEENVQKENVQQKSVQKVNVQEENVQNEKIQQENVQTEDTVSRGEAK